MPIYEYACERCGEISEFLETLGGSDNHSCQNCGSNKLKKAFSAFAARTKSSSRNPSAGRSSSCAGCSAGSCATCRR